MIDVAFVRMKEELAKLVRRLRKVHSVSYARVVVDGAMTRHTLPNDSTGDYIYVAAPE